MKCFPLRSDSQGTNEEEARSDMRLFFHLLSGNNAEAAQASVQFIAGIIPAGTGMGKNRGFLNCKDIADSGPPDKRPSGLYLEAPKKTHEKFR